MHDLPKILNERQRLIKDNFDLRQTALQFPNHAEELIRPVLDDPKERQRLIKDNFDLRQTALQFPNHAEELIRPVLHYSKEQQQVISVDSCYSTTSNSFVPHVEKLSHRKSKHATFFTSRSVNGMETSISDEAFVAFYSKNKK